MRDRTTRRDIAALFTRQILNQKNQYIFLISNNYHESVNSLMHNKKRKSQPVSRVLSRTAIHLGCKSPCSSSNLPRNRAGHASVPLFDLAPGGVYHATSVTSCAVRSYRTFSPLPVIAAGGIFSAALSVGSRLPGVTWHPAQWSPDFPPFYLDDKTATAQPTLSALSIQHSSCQHQPSNQ